MNRDYLPKKWLRIVEDAERSNVHHVRLGHGPHCVRVDCVGAVPGASVLLWADGTATNSGDLAPDMRSVREVRRVLGLRLEARP